MFSHKIVLAGLFCLASLPIMLQPNQDQEPEAARISNRDLVVLYAQTKMELAKAELDWAQQATPGTVSKFRIARLQTDLTVAKEQYKQTVLASSGGTEKVRICHAEEKVRLARLDLESARKLDEQGAIRPFAVKRAELKFELAELNLALLKNPQYYVTLIEALQAQIDRHSEELLALDLRVTRLETEHDSRP